jgi:Phage integrase, N-terminal SAM-like domain
VGHGCTIVDHPGSLRLSCPKCGGKLIESEQRRRATQAGFVSKKERPASMAEVISAVDEQRFALPVRLTLREYLEKEWLPAITSTVRATTYRSYRGHIEYHIVPGTDRSSAAFTKMRYGSSSDRDASRSQVLLLESRERRRKLRAAQIPSRTRLTPA